MNVYCCNVYIKTTGNKAMQLNRRTAIYIYCSPSTGWDITQLLKIINQSDSMDLEGVPKGMTERKYQDAEKYSISNFKNSMPNI